jgi:arylsulfatase A-like enzyme
MFLGFSHPHDPRNGLPELLERYGAINTKAPPEEVNPAAPPLPANYLPEHPFFHGHPNLRDEVNVPGLLRSRTEAAVRNELGREYACIENIDREVGRVLTKLEEMGELARTYVVFTSDHGIAVGRHGLAGKQNLYEHTWRVPFLVRGPGIRPGSAASGFLYLMDVFPTFCDLAGIPVPDGVDGLSFRPVLEGKKERVRDVLYGVYCGGTKPGMRSIKTAGGWKLIKYDVMEGSVRETQLFNLKENPEEFLREHQEPAVEELTGHSPSAAQVDLAEDPRFADRRRALETLLLKDMKRFEDPYRLWDQQNIEPVE